ncbi:MAG TPA: molybdopterin-dependent oxidoreductase [Solirubrobacteraceae bacterium]|nr:molybdopterin-dependent oxidoreductase [Solirubrobacteraceae bacterium]
MRAPWPADPPPGPFRGTFWRSPLRGPWLTAFLGTLLLALTSVVILTGFLSHAAYEPDLGRNAIVPRDGDLPGLLPFDWPTSPSWLYAFTQGLHVTVGFVAVPFLLAKLWSVIPRLFAWPPVASPAQALERIAIALLVGSALFQFATGVLNAQIYYPFKFNFVVAHYYGAIVFTASLLLHVLVKLPTIRHAYRERGVLQPLRANLASTEPEPYDPDGGLAPEHPDKPTLSRRGLLGLTAGGGALVAVMLGGQSIGGPLRKLSLLAPRREGFPVNKTAKAAEITAEMTGDGWRLELIHDGRKTRLTRADLAGMEQRRESLPIACVEGWSTTQSWSGVRLADLAKAAGADPENVTCLVESLQPAGVLRTATLNGGQVRDDRSLLALQVNGADLSLDHGYPARIIVPALPGVHNTKWVARMTFS